MDVDLQRALLADPQDNVFPMNSTKRFLSFAALLTLSALYIGCGGSKDSTLSVSPTSASIQVGATQQLTARVTKSGVGSTDVTSKVTWSSSAPSVASVSTTGLVTGIGAGSATISVGYSGAAVSSSITVAGATTDGGSLPDQASADLNGVVDMAAPVAVPVLTGILPQRGVEAGGTSVVLTGVHLMTTKSVMFGNTPATSFTVDSDTQITVLSPPGTGGVNVTVTTAGGASTGLPFGYGSAPVITGISPAYGLSEGGDVVSITGSSFTGVNSITFGGAAAGSFTINSDSQITVVTPAHADGTVQVVVGSVISSSNGFSFVYGESPTLGSASPTTGSNAGGTTVTLTGTHISTATKVSFGSTDVTTITVIDDNHISVTTPAHANGSVAVTVTTPFGVADNEVVFTFGDSPALGSASPSFSPTAGGATIEITGTHLTGTTAVKFGTAAATSFTVDSDTQITAVSPAGMSSVNITVTTPYGTSAGLAFAYGDAPTVTSLNPTIGLVAGGTSVVITGSGFTSATAVKFGTTDATSFTVDSATQITAVSPAQEPGAVQVKVMTGFGTSNGSTFTYGAAPTLTSAAPGMGTTLGGTKVVLTGTNLTGTTAVKFGTVAAASFTVDSSTQITAHSPAGSAGDSAVTAMTPYGTSNSVKFTYGVTPVLSSLSPTKGDVDGGTSVVITGTSLDSATAVSFGSTAATSFHIDSSTQITAVAAGGTFQSVNVTVDSPYGTSNGLPFAYGVAPTITGLSPNVGLTAGGTTVTINGTAFTSTSTVLFGSAMITPTFVSSTQLTVTSPAHTAGAVNVTATGTFGTSNASTFTYGVAPTVSGISPASGSTAGGTTVTVTGTNLTGTTGITFGGTAGTSLMVVDDTEVTVSSPAGTTGAATVLVTTSYGTASTTFTYVTPPTLTSLSPTSGPPAGGTSVTLTGTNFTGATGVTFAGTAATNVTVVSDTTVTATTPAHAAGAVDVVVVTPGGSATSTGGFTYGGPSACGNGTAGASLTSVLVGQKLFHGTGFNSVLGYTVSPSAVRICTSANGPTGCSGPWTGPMDAPDGTPMSQETTMRLSGATNTPLTVGVCYSLCSPDSSKCTNGQVAQ